MWNITVEAHINCANGYVSSGVRVFIKEQIFGDYIYSNVFSLGQYWSGEHLVLWRLFLSWHFMGFLVQWNLIVCRKYPLSISLHNVGCLQIWRWTWTSHYSSTHKVWSSKLIFGTPLLFLSYKANVMTIGLFLMESMGADHLEMFSSSVELLTTLATDIRS